MRRAFDTLTKATGRPPVGVRVSSWDFSATTLPLIRDLVLLYSSPLWVDAASFALVAVCRGHLSRRVGGRGGRGRALPAHDASAYHRAPLADRDARRADSLHEGCARRVVRDARGSGALLQRCGAV